MGVRFPSVSSNVIVASPPATGAETVICTLPALNLPLDFAQVIILWDAIFNPGTGTSAVIYRLRRGTTTAGVLVGGNSASVIVTAATVTQQSGVGFDTPGAAAGQQYSLTYSSSATTGAWTVFEANMVAFVL